MYQVWQCTRSTAGRRPAITRSWASVSSTFACRLSTGVDANGGNDPLDMQPGFVDALVAEAHDIHGHVAKADQLAREVFDVHPRAAVYVRRVLVGQDADAHA